MLGVKGFLGNMECWVVHGEAPWDEGGEKKVAVDLYYIIVAPHPNPLLRGSGASGRHEQGVPPFG